MDQISKMVSVTLTFIWLAIAITIGFCYWLGIFSLPSYTICPFLYDKDVSVYSCRVILDMKLVIFSIFTAVVSTMIFGFAIINIFEDSNGEVNGTAG